MESNQKVKDEYIKAHRNLWLWIAKETLRRKYLVRKKTYFEENNKPHVSNSCYLCEYKRVFKGTCDNCLIDWGTDHCTRSIYREWKNEKDVKRRALLAYKISKLPERI